MSETNIYSLYSKLDDLLFLIETQLKNAERTARKDLEATDKLQKIIMDVYMSHPDNTAGPKMGRWSQYSSLADRMEKHMESYSTAKGLHLRSTNDLIKTAEMLNQIKSALASVPFDNGIRYSNSRK